MKIKMPKLPNFPGRRKKRLRAATARRSFGASAPTDYEEMSEPNMKLSRALLIVLVLHIVAVAGIIAFNAIKTRQASVASTPIVRTESSPAGSKNKAVATAPKSVVAQKNVASRDETKPSHSPAKAVAKDEHKSEHAKGSENAGSGKTYVVVKGDNPVTIAKKLKVSYDELIALNHIEDPRKLQIGQKLLIPAKTKKRGDE
jgi:nucleoid-associated protein YgaU